MSEERPASAIESAIGGFVRGYTAVRNARLAEKALVGEGAATSNEAEPESSEPLPDSQPAGARRGRKKGLTKQQAAKNYRSFALAYMDPTSPTYRNASETYLAMFPEYSKKDSYRRGHKFVHHPMVKKEIARIQARTNAHADLTPGEYLQLLMQREQYYATRGEPGDATASTNLLKLIGQTGGYLVQRIEAKVESTEKHVHEIGEDTVNQFLEAAERLKRLREPNPLPQITAKAEAVDADYSIEDGNGEPTA